MWSLVSRPGQASEPESSRLFCEPCPAPPQRRTESKTPLHFGHHGSVGAGPACRSGAGTSSQVGWTQLAPAPRVREATRQPSWRRAALFSLPQVRERPSPGVAVACAPRAQQGVPAGAPPASVRSERRQTCVFPCQHVPCVCVHACVCARACVCTRVCVHVCVCAHMLVPTSVTCRPQPCWPLASSVGTSTH